MPAIMTTYRPFLLAGERISGKPIGPDTTGAHFTQNLSFSRFGGGLP
jgi:hypothetical protein